MTVAVEVAGIEYFVVDRETFNKIWNFSGFRYSSTTGPLEELGWFVALFGERQPHRLLCLHRMVCMSEKSYAELLASDQAKPAEAPFPALFSEDLLDYLGASLRSGF